MHLIINELGEIIAFDLTPGNVDDRNRSVINKLTQRFKGKLFGDRGYISGPLFKELFARGIRLFTRVKKTMKNTLLTLTDKILLSKRGVIEAVNGLLKNECLIQHSRHRSTVNFFVHLLAGLAAYSFRPTKPSLKLALDGFIECGD